MTSISGNDSSLKVSASSDPYPFPRHNPSGHEDYGHISYPKHFPGRFSGGYGTDREDGFKPSVYEDQESGPYDYQDKYPGPDSYVKQAYKPREYHGHDGHGGYDGHDGHAEYPGHSGYGPPQHQQHYGYEPHYHSRPGYHEKKNPLQEIFKMIPFGNKIKETRPYHEPQYNKYPDPHSYGKMYYPSEHKEEYPSRPHYTPYKEHDNIPSIKKLIPDMPDIIPKGLLSGEVFKKAA